MTATLVIGIGNSGRGDDGAGLEVVRRLRARLVGQAEVCECDGEATGLLEAWRGHARVILVDAALGGGRPGSVRRFEAHQEPLPAALLHASTHSWGVAEAVELARSLGLLPRSLVVVALEGRCFEPGERLSDAAAQAVERACEEVLSELERAARLDPSHAGA